MVYFLIPLRSKYASKNWQRVTANFNRTLWSCYNQTNDDFRIVTVCHDMPELNQEYDKRVSFVRVETPTPTNTKEMMLDKAYKMYTGMLYIHNEMRKKSQRGG